MRKILPLILVAACFSVKVFSQTAFTLSGTITGEPNAWLNFSYIGPNGKPVMDSCSLQSGTFSFKGNITGATIANLVAYKGKYRPALSDDPNFATIFIEPGNITVTGTYNHLQDLTVSGSKTHNEYLKWLSLIAEIHAQSAPIRARYSFLANEHTIAEKQGKNQNILDSLEKKKSAIEVDLNTSRNKIKIINRHYILDNPNSFVTAYLMYTLARTWPLDTVEMIYNKFSPIVQASQYGQWLERYIISLGGSSNKKPVINFTTNDVNGNRLSLSDFKGKYVLLDFWASWCIPCRESTPHLMALYKKYNKAGLEVVAVADDDATPVEWKKAIRKDKTEMWHHVLRGMKNAPGGGPDRSNSISDKFGIEALPTKILVDPNGIVVARFVGTEDTGAMDKKLAEIFK